LPGFEDKWYEIVEVKRFYLFTYGLNISVLRHNFYKEVNLWIRKVQVRALTEQQKPPLWGFCCEGRILTCTASSATLTEQP